MALSVSQTLVKDLQIASQSPKELPSCKPVFSLSPIGLTKHFPQKKSVLALSERRDTLSLSGLNKSVYFGSADVGFQRQELNYGRGTSMGMLIVRAAATAEKPKKRYPGEAKGFVEEMRFVAMKLHTKDVAKEGEKEPDAEPIGKWEPTIEGYLKFLVDSKLVYDTLEKIVQKATHPACE
eukprot:Gb_21799 [translate_table: standard]